MGQRVNDDQKAADALAREQGVYRLRVPAEGYVRLERKTGEKQQWRRPGGLPNNPKKDKHK